jgi:hypothetical protein
MAYKIYCILSMATPATGRRRNYFPGEDATAVATDAVARTTTTPGTPNYR